MGGCGEQASPHLVIDVVIQATGAPSLEGCPCQVSGTSLTAAGTIRLIGGLCHPPSGWPAGALRLGSVPDGSGSGAAGSRQQAEFGGPADCCPAAGHRELGVDVLGVSP